MAQQSEQRRVPWQVVVGTHRAAHHADTGERPGIGRYGIAAIELNHLPRDVLRVEPVAEMSGTFGRGEAKMATGFMTVSAIVPRHHCFARRGTIASPAAAPRATGMHQPRCYDLRTWRPSAPARRPRRPSRPEPRGIRHSEQTRHAATNPDVRQRDSDQPRDRRRDDSVGTAGPRATSCPLHRSGVRRRMRPVDPRRAAAGHASRLRAERRSARGRAFPARRRVGSNFEKQRRAPALIAIRSIAACANSRCRIFTNISTNAGARRCAAIRSRSTCDASIPGFGSPGTPCARRRTPASRSTALRVDATARGATALAPRCVRTTRRSDRRIPSCRRSR